MKQIDRIRKFSDAFGPSGFEDAVVAYAQEEVREICTCKEDHMRNLYMNLKGNSQGGVNICLLYTSNNRTGVCGCDAAGLPENAIYSGCITGRCYRL